VVVIIAVTYSKTFGTSQRKKKSSEKEEKTVEKKTRTFLRRYVSLAVSESLVWASEMS